MHGDSGLIADALAYMAIRYMNMKMAFSCKWLYDEIEANPLYRLAAARMLGVV